MEIQEQHLVVPRTARYQIQGSPDDDLHSVWFLCHGYGQLAVELLRSAKALVHEERLMVAPEALSRFYHADHKTIGASWMTREDRGHEMDDYIRYLDLVHDQVFQIVPRDAVRLTLLGFSQGCATAARWAARGHAKVDRLVLWGQALPPELDDEASTAPLKAQHLTLVRGSRDKLFPKEQHEEQRRRLSRHGVPFTEMDFDGGHRLDDDTLVKLAGDEQGSP